MTEILACVVESSHGTDNMTGFVCSFRCWDDDENGVVLWIIKGPILLTVLVWVFSFFLEYLLKYES